jgi:hypothetical protein
LGLRSRMFSIALLRADSFMVLFMQLAQLQPLQYRPDAKHSQYSFRHFELRQLQVLLSPLAVALAGRREAEGGFDPG